MCDRVAYARETPTTEITQTMRALTLPVSSPTEAGRAVAIAGVARKANGPWSWG